MQIKLGNINLELESDNVKGDMILYGIKRLYNDNIIYQQVIDLTKLPPNIREKLAKKFKEIEKIILEGCEECA